LIANSTANTQLCPSCANSIGEDATECPYCKANISSEFGPRWLRRDQSSSEPKSVTGSDRKFSIPGRFVWPGAVLAAALIAFFAGRYMQRGELSHSAQAHLKQLQSKDQMIQSQEAQLAQTRQQLKESTTQLAEMKAKLEENQKALSLTEQRLSSAARQADRLNTSRSPVTRTASRAPNTAATIPQPAAARQTAAPGVYETTRATSVHEDPSSTSRVISQISGGTRINVVGAAGGWLEVRSKRGNPPGYVRAEDARPIGRAS
jgi:hypothetical protein